MPSRLITQESDERRKIIILYLGTMVIMLLLLYATYLNLRQYYTSAQVVRQNDLALVELATMVSVVHAQESALHTFLVTGDTLELAPIASLGRRSAQYRQRLDSLLSGSTWQAQLTALQHGEDRVRASIGAFLTTLHEEPNNGQTQLQAMQRVRIATENLLAMHERMASTVGSARQPRLEAMSTDGFSTPIILVLYVLIATGATALLFWRVSHALSGTEVAKRDLQHKLEELDQEVRTRSSIQKMLQRVLDTSPNGIMTFTAVRDEADRIVDFTFSSTNQRAIEMVGRSDLVGKRLLEEMPENRTTGLFDAYCAVVETGAPYRNELLYQGSGLNAWFSNHAVRLEDGFMVTFTDVTEQRRLQELRSETELLALTGQLTRTVAHEVRNPLTNIQLSMEQLHDEVEDRGELVQPFFDIIERNVKRIGGLINGMLESSRKRELNLVPCSMNDILENAIKHVADRLKLKRVNGELDVAPDLPQVLADCELINLAITNIAVNAVEAMEEGKGLLRMTAYRNGDEVCMDLTDNGKGIPPESLSRLFEPFYSGRPGGLGLGLTTTRSILNSLQVKMEVRSAVGKGTTFTLRFPSTVFVPGT